MNISITGGAGFIGCHLIRKLKETKGITAIRVLDNFDPQVHGPESPKSFELEFPDIYLRRGCIDNFEDARWVVEEADVVFHLAAQTGTGQSMYAVSQYTSVNVSGTACLIEAILNRPEPLSSFVLASSRSIYGEGSYDNCLGCGYAPEGPHRRYETDLREKKFEIYCRKCGAPLTAIPTTERAAYDPRSYYALTKLMQEQQIGIYAHRLSRSLNIFRFQNVYGPGQSLTNPYTGILAIFSSLCRAGSPINVFEDGLESRDFVYVEDVAKTLVRTMQSDCEEGVRTFNLGTGCAVSVHSVAEKINGFFGGKSQIRVSGDFRVGDIRHNMASMAAATDAKIFFGDFKDFNSGLSIFLESISTATEGMPALLNRSFEQMRARGLLVSGKDDG